MRPLIKCLIKKKELTDQLLLRHLADIYYEFYHRKKCFQLTFISVNKLFSKFNFLPIATSNYFHICVNSNSGFKPS